MKYSESELLKIEDNGKTLLENLIENNMEIYCTFCDERSIKIIFDHKRFDLLSQVSVDLLFKQIILTVHI